MSPGVSSGDIAIYPGVPDPADSYPLASAKEQKNMKFLILYLSCGLSDITVPHDIDRV
jgi:hypothetical protein